MTSSCRDSKATNDTKTTEAHTNRLIHEKSPYLLQHAHNPVDWYPWGEEAFEKAEREDKPIFLSIGYSTCHWCHVMEHESFEDAEVAALMNEAFVSIKVDREERPDIDHIYMTVCQMLTQHGGWPLTIIMTPDRKPFFAGTYFPKNGRLGRMGMMDLVPRIQEVWETKRDDVLQSAQQITSSLQQASEDTSGAALGPAALENSYRQFVNRFDSEHGGFGTAPKFPTPHNLLFLLRYWKRSGELHALRMVETTLQTMRRGGVYDHVGFGFHRYSTDSRWLLPHFEKMLYDQALLAMAYTETYQATGKGEYAQTAREILTYVLRDMTAAEGGFYSAEDADSEGEEGKFYVWTEEELRQTLDDGDADFVIQMFNTKKEGNFSEEATGHRTGGNILHLMEDTREPDSDRRWETIRQKLFDVREGRIHPYKDDKVLTDWNGLMIAALAKAAQTLQAPEYAEAAERAASFLLGTLRDSKGRLLHRYRDGEAALQAHADDYAFLIWGLLELYEATFTVSYLESAIELNDQFLEHYWDDEDDGFYFTADDAEELLVRHKESYDGAIPAANSVAALNLLRLARITARTDLEEKAVAVGQAFSANVQRMPSAHTLMLMAVDFGLGPSYEVVIAGNPEAEDTQQMLAQLHSTYIPNKVVLLRSEQDPKSLTQLASFTEFQTSLDGKATAYVCLNYACKLPTTDPEQMLALLAPSVNTTE